MKRRKAARRAQRAVQRSTRKRVAAAPAAAPAPPAVPGQTVAAEAEAPTRRDTRFKPGNWDSVKHLVYSERLSPGLEHLPALLDRFHAAQLADEGEEPDRIPARRRSLLDIRAFVVQRNIVKLAHALEVRGLLDSKGKLRSTWLQMLAVYIDKAIRLDSLLGLQRRPRAVKQTTREWLLDGHAEQQHDHDDDQTSQTGEPADSEHSSTESPHDGSASARLDQ